MTKFLDPFLSLIGRGKPSPTTTVGAPGTPVYGGFITENEKDTTLTYQQKYKTYSEMMANISIVAAGVRYFLNLITRPAWTFVPSEADTTGKFAKRAEEILTKDPNTSWHRIIRRAAMYRFYGFSIQEWTAKRREDGVLTYADIAPRAQRTIEKWDLLKNGDVAGVIQRAPQDSAELYLPREKIVYIVDDSISDSPEGLGLFRHIVASSRRLERYEQLEGFGFETDLRGIPVGRGPFLELMAMVTAGTITQEQRIEAEKPMRDFITNHIKGPKLGMLIDSMTYQSSDDKATPSTNKQWDIELLKGDPTSLEQNAQAIERVNHEIARVLGVEVLLLGSKASGSYSLSKDKTNNLFLVIESTLSEIKESIKRDLLERTWQLNGWDPEMMPTMKTSSIHEIDVEKVTTAINDLARAGAILAPDDPIIDAIRSLMDLPAADNSSMANDAELNSGRERQELSEETV